MELEDLFTIAKEHDSEYFRRKLNDFVIQHPQFSNLSQDNKKILLDLIHKHIDMIRKGVGISAYVIQQETHRLYENRLKLKITEKDLEDIREIMGLFKK
ncbi:MAG: hypothetical protein NTY12_00110 [Candidatus Falkowbacteria bacterium]|nr:hypothetical protein [Candidatus Falkowbacteria bacterium]